MYNLIPRMKKLYEKKYSDEKKELWRVNELFPIFFGMYCCGLFYQRIHWHLRNISRKSPFYAFHEFAKRKSKILTTDEKRNERTRMVLIYMALNKKSAHTDTCRNVHGMYLNSSIFGENATVIFFFQHTLIRREISLRVSMHKFCIINTLGVMYHF